MKYKKLKAFTLAELMILLLTLSILMAAFAPVFTRRYNNASADDVWAFVSGDDNEDAYFDTVNKSHTAQAFIGLTPADESAVKAMSSDNSGNVLYSKLVIAAGDDVNISGSKKKQNQILFRYATGSNDKVGDPVGALFADGSNFLLGGLYNNTVTGNGNTAYGVGALQSLASGLGNTAVGKDALLKLKSGVYNTAIGVGAAKTAESSSFNTAIGDNSMANITGGRNTAVGNNSMGSGSGSAHSNTALGVNSLKNITSGSYNVGVGYGALHAVTTGSYNTAVGYFSMINLKTGNYNTAVGAYSCNSSNLTGSSYKTCIGYDSGNTGMEALYNTADERVFIGGKPADMVNPNGNDLPAAVLEVHNIKKDVLGQTKSPSKYNPAPNGKTTAPIPFIGDSSVVINGNLIVRGNPYFETPIHRPSNLKAGLVAYKVDDEDDIADPYPNAHIPKGLVLYHLLLNGNTNVFSGFDGFKRTEYSWETCRGSCGRGSHQFKDVRPNCICTGVNIQSFQPTANSGLRGFKENGDENPISGNNMNLGYARTNFDTTYDHYEKFKVLPSSTSYDWASKTYAVGADNENTRSPYNGTAKIFPSEFGGNTMSCNNYYDDNHTPPVPGTDRNNCTGTCESHQSPASNTFPYINSGAYYKDRSFNRYIYLERRPTRCNHGFDNDGECSKHQYGMKGTDKPYAHMRLRDAVGGKNINNSCCPILTDVEENENNPYKDLNTGNNSRFNLSDRRLKNVGERFTAGLDEIRKLNIYNYTFKTDKNNLPQVGVIAQDLRMVFPNAVSKDENGYYKIRWDEMFYAAINSIKTLYTKAESLVAQVARDKQKVTTLKADAKELNAKLDNLEKEIAKLEADKR